MAAVIERTETEKSILSVSSTRVETLPITVVRVDPQADPDFFDAVTKARGDAYKMHTLARSQGRIDMQRYNALVAKLREINGHPTEAIQVPYQDTFDNTPRLSTTFVALDTRELDEGVAPQQAMLGTLRAVHGSIEHGLDLYHLMTDLPTRITETPGSYTEVGRFALFGTHDPTITRALYDSAARMAVELDQPYILAIMPTFVMQHASRAGIKSTPVSGQPNWDSKPLLELVRAYPRYWLGDPQVYKLSTE